MVPADSIFHVTPGFLEPHEPNIFIIPNIYQYANVPYTCLLCREYGSTQKSDKLPCHDKVVHLSSSGSSRDLRSWLPITNPDNPKELPRAKTRRNLVSTYTKKH